MHLLWKTEVVSWAVDLATKVVHFLCVSSVADSIPMWQYIDVDQLTRPVSKYMLLIFIAEYRHLSF